MCNLMYQGNEVWRGDLHQVLLLSLFKATVEQLRDSAYALYWREAE